MSSAFCYVVDAENQLLVLGNCLKTVEIITGPSNLQCGGQSTVQECMGFLQVLPSLGDSSLTSPGSYQTEVVANTDPVSEQHIYKFSYIQYGWTRARRRYGPIQLGQGGGSSGHCHCFGVPSG